MSNKESKSPSEIMELSKPIHDFHEDVKCKLLNWTNDLYADHYDSKKGVLDSVQTVIKSRLSSQLAPKVQEKFDKIIAKHYINSEKELWNQSFSLVQVWYDHSDILNQNLKVFQKLRHNEEKNLEKEMFK